MRLGVVGASGYVGGELLRLLLFHPRVEVQQATSESQAGRLVAGVHPNLRKLTTLRFCSLDELEPGDLLFSALPHGQLMLRFDRLRAIAPRIIDLSADFRFRSAEAYKQWYGHEHTRPEAMGQFVYRIPELHREEIRNATHVTAPDAWRRRRFWG
jgi:N-acetyl-gamma-glutamyl-phosphate/LysW-gamma-L-alpha-aminoadipyl-6-phosphate reductase